VIVGNDVGMTVSHPDRKRSDAWLGMAIAGLAPITVAALLVPLRETLDNTNLALILVVVVVLTAVLGGRAAGALSAVVAAISFDFFLTRPYLTLRMDSADDIETTVLLLVVGLIVGQLSVRSAQYRATATAGHTAIQRIHHVADLVAQGGDEETVIAAVSNELTELLELRACRYETQPGPTPLPRLETTGRISGRTEWRWARRGEFELPREGVELPVLSHGVEVGRFVLEPSEGVGISTEECIVALALADQVGAVVTDARPAEGTSARGTNGSTTR
jgi:hypothetical protein